MGSQVTFSVGLLEKLAGMKKPEPPKPPAPFPTPRLPIGPSVSPEAARILAQDRQLTRQLQATKEVAGLLVKQEAADVAAMQAKAEELLRQYGVAPKPAPCQAEAAACAQCFREHAQDAWRCQEAADAYRLCSTAAFNASAAAARG